MLRRLLFFLPLLSVGSLSAGTNAVGRYAPALLPGTPLAADVWRKDPQAGVAPDTTARIQALYDMMCERIDLFSTDYTNAPGLLKTDAVRPGYPSVAHRRALAESADTAPDGSLAAQAYADMCVWLERDPTLPAHPSVVTQLVDVVVPPVEEGGSPTTAMATNCWYYPSWQSPLCHDIALTVTPTGLTSTATDVYPGSLTRFGHTPFVRDDIAVALSNVAAACRTAYTPDRTLLPLSDLDSQFCGFVDGSIVRYVDEIAPFGAGGRLAWAPYYAFDRICSDLASRNVAVLDLDRLRDAGRLFYETRVSADTYAYTFTGSGLEEWLLSVWSNGSDMETATFEPTLRKTVGGVSRTVALAAPIASAFIFPNAYAAANGYVYATGRYVLEDYSSNEWSSPSTEEVNGYSVQYKTRTAYKATLQMDTPVIVWNGSPLASFTVNKADVGFRFVHTNGGDRVFCANAAFSEYPESFRGARLTLLASATNSVSSGGVSRQEETTLACHQVSVTNADVTADLEEASYGLLRVTNEELQRLCLSPGSLSVTVTPTYVSQEYYIYECQASYSGGTATYACRDNTPYPIPRGSGFYPPEDGATYASYYRANQQLPVTFSAPFTSAYTADVTNVRGGVFKQFGTTQVVCENEYDLTGWSGHVEPLTDPLQGIGPQADYGDGDGGTDDFDVWVDASAPASGDGSKANPFRSLDAAVAAVNPNGGACAVTNRVPKIGVRAGTYAFPSFFNRSIYNLPPYDVRIIGIGTSVTLTKTTPTVGRGTEGSSFSSLQTKLENLTILVSGQWLRGLDFFRISYCRITGACRPKYGLIEATYVDHSLFTGLSVYCYGTEFNMNGIHKPLIYGSKAETCVFLMTPHPDGSIPLFNVSDILDCYIVGSSWDRIQTKGGEGWIADSTFCPDELANADRPTAENCLFFTSPFSGTSDEFTDNIVTNTSSFSDIISQKTYTPNERNKVLRRHGFRRYLRQE